MARVLVTDGEQRAALAVVRSLGRAGHAPEVCSVRGSSLAGASRHARARFALPDPLREPEGFATAVLALVDRRAIEVVLPVAEASMLALLPHLDALAGRGVRIPFPGIDAFRRISDKALLLRVARKLGIAVPDQREYADREAALADPPPGFPVVLKPARSIGEAAGDRRKVGVVHAEDARRFRERIAELPAQAFPLLAQQRVVGPGVGIFLLTWKGERIATFAHRRIREKPPSGGVSVYRESVPADPALVERSAALLREFAWDGVAMVEFKIDDATGIPYLMEVNGRFWGSLQLAIDAGVDFPRLLVEAALGERPEPVDRYRTGVRSRWWWGDFDHLLARVRRSDVELALPPGSPSRSRAVADFLTLWRPGDRGEVFRLDDPRPALHEAAEWFRGR
jgi:predicted ATP-grasp superfamily ATP-dependent carboligase